MPRDYDEFPNHTTNPRSPALSDNTGNAMYSGNTSAADVGSGDSVYPIDSRIREREDYGILNGDLARGPFDSTRAIEAGNNLPDIDGPFNGGTTLGISCTWVSGLTSPSTYGVRFTVPAGLADDYAYLQPVTVPVGGDMRGTFPHLGRAIFNSNTSAAFAVIIALQYLTASGAATGTEQTATKTISGTGVYSVQASASSSEIMPIDATQLRVRVGVQRGSAATTDTGTVDLVGLRLSNRVSLREYTSAGGSTYNIPSGAQRLDIVIIGGGGGGGSGRRAAAATARGGGGGGAGGMMSVLSLTRSQISGDTISVTVGAAGTAGADIGSGATGNGADGGQGGDSSVTVGSTTYTALGGSFGGGGVNVGSSSRGVGAAIVGVFNGGSGGAGYFNSFGDDATAVIGPGPGGGGGGGGIDTANTTYVGGGGFGPAIALTLGGSGGTTLVIATSGSAPSASIGGGGGGGGSATAGLANHRGGNGARGGGGGGGSGLTSATSSSNAGGSGGAGYVSIFAS